MNFDRLRYVSERAQIGEKREAVIAITIPEQPGAFLKLRNLIGDDRNVTEFNYRFNSNGSFLANVYCAFEIENTDQIITMVEKLSRAGFPCINLTDNEVAKMHVRHLVGGRVPDNGVREKILRFEFPEIPGASLNFLTKLHENGDFNISLFHYRSHGSDIGRVLCGF